MNYQKYKDLFRTMFVAIVLSAFLSACGDEITTVTNPAAGGSSVTATDGDGDGLSDVREKALGTSPVLTDTDADGFDDFEEVVTLGFDASVNNLRFNPLIADLPQISVEVTSTPDISLNYTETDGTSTSVSTNRSQSSSQSVTNSRTLEESSSVETSLSTGLEVGIESSTNVGTETGGEIKQSAKISYAASLAFTETTSNSWTNGQTTENATALDQGESFEENHELSAADGSLAVTVEITNVGNITYSLY